MLSGECHLRGSSSSEDSLLAHISGLPQLDSDENPDDNILADDLEADDDDENCDTSCSPSSGGRAAETLYHYQRSDNDTVHSTQSLYDTDILYLMIHGRRYCKDYYMPNDDDEQVRSQMLHGIHLYVFNQALTTVPLDNPSKILDIGCGTGEWAIEMADEFPQAEVIGTDIAKIQPSAVPLNVFFEIDDAEEDGGWTWPEDEFDLIHFRTMAGAFRSWNYIYNEAYTHLKPGGWIEVIDFDDHRELMSYYDEDSGVPTWLAAIREATALSGRPRSAAHLDPQILTSLGFVDVQQSSRDIPFGNWPEDPEAQQIGKHFLVAQLCGIEALCLRPLTETLGWDPDEVKRMCAIVTEGTRAVALDPGRSKGMAFTLKCLVGRKPTCPKKEFGAMTNAEALNRRSK